MVRRFAPTLPPDFVETTDGPAEAVAGYKLQRYDALFPASSGFRRNHHGLSKTA